MFRRSVALLCGLLLLSVLMLAGCAENGDMLPGINSIGENDANGNNSSNENGEDEPTPDEVIAHWLEYSREMFLAQVRELDGQQYLLVTYGQKESGGYGVEIIDVEVGEEKVTVEVKFTAPGEDEQVTDEETYPYALEVIQATGLPVEFVASGAQDVVPHITDITYLQPIVAEAEHIKIFAPAPDEQVGHQFTMQGIIKEHEGNVQYKLMDGSGTVLVSGLTGMVASEDWKYFSINVVMDESVSAEDGLLMEVSTQSAQNGAVQDLVQMNLTLREEVSTDS